MMEMPCPDAIDPTTWTMMVAFGRWTGARASELAQLEVEDIVVVQGIRCMRITARGEGRSLKTAAAERVIPVSERLAPYLDRLLLQRKTGRLFDAGDRTAPDGAVTRAHKFLLHFNRRAKAIAPDLSYHCLRTYANTWMTNGGVDVIDRSRLMGHRVQGVQAAYTAPNIARMKIAVDAIP